MKNSALVIVGLLIGFATCFFMPEPPPQIVRIPDTRFVPVRVEHPIYLHANCPAPPKAECRCISPDLVLKLARQGKACELTGEQNITVMK